MPDRTYVYIDGESHYIRSQWAWRKIHGNNACLSQLRFVNQHDDKLILIVPQASVFWTKKFHPEAYQSVYFTSAVGDSTVVFNAKLSLKNFGLEPHVIHEPKNLASQRADLLDKDGVIEKPKGVDIGLAVRMLRDAFANYYEVCHLYTSDVDFLPVIEAVRALGKQVFVHGYRAGLAKESPLLIVPNNFYDLETSLRSECEAKS